MLRNRNQLALSAMMIWALAWVAAPSVSFGSAVSACERMISIAPEEKVLIGDLPQKIDFTVSKDQARQYFELSQKLYDKNVEFSALPPLLKKIEKGSISSLTSNEVASLKSFRKYALIMRTGFELFSDAHSAPAALDDFVTDLGHLNDDIAIKDEEGAHNDAHDLRDEADTLSNLDLRSKFKPASRGSAEDYVEDRIETIEKVMEKKRVKATQFHEVRKIVKELMSIYRFKIAVESDATAATADQKIYDFLFQLNEDMGLVHDDLVAQDFHQKIDYDDYKLSIPLRVRQRINAILKRIDS